MPMWCSVDSDDKSPQNLIKKSLAYLDGKIMVNELRAERKQSTIDDFMNAVDEYGESASAAVAAWDAMVVALEDESYLEPWDSDLTDEDIDAYERDAAKEACVAWSNAYTDGDNGKYVIREMRFWAWYMEEAAKIAGLENYRFPPRYIKAFKEKQNPPKPVPEEVTLESFCEFLGVGEYVYNIKGESEISYYNKKPTITTKPNILISTKLRQDCRKNTVFALFVKNRLIISNVFLQTEVLTGTSLLSRKNIRKLT